MQKLLSLSLIILAFAVAAFSQKPATPLPLNAARAFIVKKQIFVDDIDSSLNTVQYAAVRIYIRYKLAEWLWKNGKDDTDRAEALAVKAVDEYYDKATEIPKDSGADLIGPVFDLLDDYAKATSARLKAKYKYVDENELMKSGMNDLQKPGGDKLVADKIRRSLAKGGEPDYSINLLLDDLCAMRSPQYAAVLNAILDACESSPSGKELFMLLSADDLIDPIVPIPVRRRYFNLLLTNARAELMQPTGEDDYSELLAGAIKALGNDLPDLVPEAEALKNVWVKKRSQKERSLDEARGRIAESSDKLAATIDEAERISDPNDKRALYYRAMSLAIAARKFGVAIDVIETIRALLPEKGSPSVTDYMLVEIFQKAYQAGDIVSGNSAIKNIHDSVKQAEAFQRAALYYAGKGDILEARDSISKALKVLSDSDRDDSRRARILLRLIRDVIKVDKTQLAENIVLAAKAINDLPAPGADDKPGTKNSDKYIIGIEEINSDLENAITLLARNNAGAADLVERIQKREVRIYADLLIGIDTLERSNQPKSYKP